MTVDRFERKQNCPLIKKLSRIEYNYLESIVFVIILEIIDNINIFR